ncbi:hypothetical protein [Flavobacterium luteolum]|uniref:hypothetical protein n=1 Tax=Flavobacterium luteolum TaxID=3003259 RepID=UPI00248DDD16|nr:hypothetical protein [Flavobacterium luteolum]
MNKKVVQLIENLVETETSKIKETFSGPSYYAVQHILRRIDFVMLFYNNDPRKTKEEVEELREFYSYGWVKALKPFYHDLNIDILESFPEMYKEAINWADGIMQFSGQIAFLIQLLDYYRSGLINLEIKNKREISFRYIVENPGVEYFDRKSRDFYRDVIVERMLEQKKQDDSLNENVIKIKLREIIRNPKGKYISYDATPEIDEYYKIKGQIFVLKLQGYDDFGEQDLFGGIPYWKYLDVVITIVGAAIMHTEACLELSKMNPSVDLHNLLTYTYYKDKTLNVYKNYFGASQDEIEQIFSCITLNKQNYNYYLEYPGAALPMYVEASDNMLVRLISGCLGNPFELLNRELKRKFEKDYFKAVNNREERFRNELFNLFPSQNLIKLQKGVNITVNGRKTDIDAVLFDTDTMTIGLFQLKWQDPFKKSMRERFSRISNLFDKAVEWVDKVENWLTNTDIKNILEILEIKKYYKGEISINEAYIFVLSRNNINFTNIDKMDDRVAWGTWYQMIESQNIVRTSSENIIKDAFIKLKTLSPKHRLKNEKLPELPNFEMQFGGYRIHHDKENKND